MTASREAYRHFLIFFSSAEDDDEPPDSSLFLGFFLQMEKITMSWEAPSSLSFLGFFFKCELTSCITTWCINIVPSCTWGCHHPLTNAKVRRKGVVRYVLFGHAPSQNEPHQWCWLEFFMCIGNSSYSICKWTQYRWRRASLARHHFFIYFYQV